MKIAVACLAVLAVVLPAAPVPAQDEPSEFLAKARKRLDPDPEVLEVGDEEAAKLLDALDAAEDEKDVNTILGALEPFLKARHKDFVKPLDKLTRNRSDSIRQLAIRALGSQDPEEKVGMKVLKCLLWKGNKDFPGVLGAAISSLRRLKFDHPKASAEIEAHFRKQLYPDVMREAARYFGELDKKQAVDMLIAWVEAPQPANVNSGTNPPASYWKRMWEIWDVIKYAVWVSLGDLSGGKDFQTEREWRDWLGTREAREMGFK